MDEVKGFTFYRNYFKFYKNLSDEDKVKLIDSILFYMFEDKEPTNLDGMVEAIWENLEMPLKTSKTNIKNGQKGGRKKSETKSEKETENITEIKTEKKPKVKAKSQANNISIFLFLFSNLNISNLNNKNNIYELLKEYLELRIKNKYTLTETVVKRLIKKLNDYGKTDEEKIEIITNAINGTWKDFYPLQNRESKPDWFEKNFNTKKPSEERLKEMEELLEEFKDG